jgi:hypothetical protein
MSNEKFTPGPWVVTNGCDIFGPLGGDSGDGVKCDHNDAWLVAEFDEYGACVDDEIVSMGKDVCTANGHLIAAAPKMYAALCQVLTVNHVHGHTLPETLNNIEKLLAEARGEQNDTS